jgi:predicted PurR-regulated permease PerM
VLENPESPNNKRPSKTTARRVFLDPSSPSIVSIVRIVVITLIILYGAGFAINVLSSLTHLFFMLILSIFFAYLIDPLVNFIRLPFQERNLEKLMPRALAIGVAYLVVFAVLGVAISYLAPRVAEQARQFATNLPGYATIAQERVAEINTRYENYKIPEELQLEINKKISASVGELAPMIPAFLGNLALTVVSYLPWLILIPILSFFFLKDANLFRISFLRVFPSGRWRARAEMVLADVNKTLAAYTRAQLFSCILIGFLCTVAFYILGLNYALLLGILAAVFEFIPLIGPLTIAVIATLVAGITGSPASAAYVAIFLIVLRILQDYVFYPRIVRGSIHLHPLGIILAVLAGEQIAGIPGVFLSIPIVALFTVIYKHVLEHSGKRGLFAELLTPKKEPEKSIIIQDTTQA